MPRSATRRADAPVTTGAMHGDRPQQRTVAAGRTASIAGSAANAELTGAQRPAQEQAT